MTRVPTPSPRRTILAALAGIALVFAAAGSAFAGEGIRLASTTSGGDKSNRSSFEPSLSGDGTIVAFRSLGRLHPDDDDDIPDIFVKNLNTGSVALASASLEEKANAFSGSPSLSGDGSVVAFHSQANNLDREDRFTDYDVYVKDLETGAVTLASTDESGEKGNATTYIGGLAFDASRVAMWTYATNFDSLDHDLFSDVYVKDLATGALQLASTTDAGVKGNANSQTPSPSSDGTRVAFLTESSNFDPADTTFDWDIYVKDLATGELVLASSSEAGEPGNGPSYAASLSADGTRVAFWSAATNLVPGDTNSHSDVFVKDLVTGEVFLASSTDTGGPANGWSRFASLSGNGTRVGFESEANLDPADTDAKWDLYVKDLATGDIALASIAFGVKGNGGSTEAAVSGDGLTVAFRSTSTNLHEEDTDGRSDIYVKRPF